jgi:hypothetical protein
MMLSFGRSVAALLICTKRLPKFFHMFILSTMCLIVLGCSKTSDITPNQPSNPDTTLSYLTLTNTTLNNVPVASSTLRLKDNVAEIRLNFSDKIDRNTVSNAVLWSSTTPSISYSNSDSTILLRSSSTLAYLTQYNITISKDLKSTSGAHLYSPFSLSICTGINPSNKFPLISDDALLDSIQKATFRYFWNYSSETSGLACDKSSTYKDYCSIGATGFGIMTLPAAIERGFITRTEGLARLQKIVDFLKNSVSSYKGVFPHFVNGNTGSVIPDGILDGWDLVETSFLMMGLLTSRQYFNNPSLEENNLRTEINRLYQDVQWSEFQNGQDVLYWSYNPTGGWQHPIRGWNETMITYVLAASSQTHSIEKSVYDNGFAQNGGMKSGNEFYGFTLPLGSDYGGQLYLSQFSFLGIKPIGLSDSYADYEVQTKNHALINHAYCKINPKKYFAYSDSCWGLTAGASKGGYVQASPSNDIGHIYPSAAVASLPYAPVESLKAIKYFYYRLGDILWTDYGFSDSFSFNTLPYWVANEVFGYDQLNMFCGIENYRTGLIWSLFTSCPEVQAGMRKLGFSAPYL